jgi:hypothetical protein
MLIISATWERIKKIEIQGQPKQKVSKIPHLNQQADYGGAHLLSPVRAGPEKELQNPI